jgi:hypothetical protein
LSTRETVATDTPEARARSLIVTLPLIAGMDFGAAGLRAAPA